MRQVSKRRFHSILYQLINRKKCSPFRISLCNSYFLLLLVLINYEILHLFIFIYTVNILFLSHELQSLYS